jgi:two-component system LytT family response regulator
VRAVIIDDEPLARAGLRLALAPHPDVELVGEAGDGRAARALIEAVAPELAFVDIQLPELDGVALAAAVGAAPSPPAVIFVTAYDEFAVDAFAVRAIDYLVKPIDDARLAQALDRARDHHRLAAAARLGDQLATSLALLRTPPSPARLTIRDGGRVHLVPLDAIDWIEAADYYVEIHAGPHTYLHRETLQHLEASLDARFRRIHRSRLVNTDRLRSLRRAGRDLVAVLADGTELAVARRYHAALKTLR